MHIFWLNYDFYITKSLTHIHKWSKCKTQSLTKDYLVFLPLGWFFCRCWFTGKLRRWRENDRHCSVKPNDLMLLFSFKSQIMTLTLLVRLIGQSSKTGLWYISILTLCFWSSGCRMSNTKRKTLRPSLLLHDSFLSPRFQFRKTLLICMTKRNCTSCAKASVLHFLREPFL